MMRRALRGPGRLGLLVLGLLVAACGGSSPTGPTPPPPPTPPPVVTPPTINGVTVSMTRVEVDTAVTVTADVTDAEKAPAELTYVWSASVGTFAGTGPSVTWLLPKDGASTPRDVVLTVTVVEPYQVIEGGQLVAREHRISRDAPAIRVHDSRHEIATMVRTFLVDYFGNISLSPDACLVDFSTNRSLCPTGRDAEFNDIRDNRANYAEVSEVQVRVDSIEFNGERTYAWISAPCLFRSRKKNGEREAFAGNCELTAVYDVGRWWLCDSFFRNPVPIPLTGSWPLRRTFGPDVPEPGTFPSYFR